MKENETKNPQKYESSRNDQYFETVLWLNVDFLIKDAKKMITIHFNKMIHTYK